MLRRTPHTLEYEEKQSWAPLTWVAQCRRGAPTVRVMHGPQVETRVQWFCEAIWDGPFAEGALHQTDAVFGSGARSEADGVTFVSSCAPVDRLQYVDIDDTVYVSNSLVALHAVCHLEPDVQHGTYYEDFGRVVDGVLTHVIPTSGPPIELVYVHNMHWDGQRIRIQKKPEAGRSFNTFADYKAFLDATIDRLTENLAATERHSPLGMMGTLSSGYDTTAVSALLAPYGLTEAITITSARGGDVDTGDAAAEHLGITLHPRARDAWKTYRRPEVPFLAADAKGEDIFLRGATERLAGRVLFTGHPGGSIWGKTMDGTRKPFARGDRSGVSLTEFRLWGGFIHAPIPFLRFSCKEDIFRISNSEAMHPWDVDSSYSRPIPRRLGEEAGVPRGAFGQTKKAASVLFHEPNLSPWTLLSRGSYVDFIRWCWARAGRDPFPLSRRDLLVLGMRQVLFGTAARAGTSVLRASRRTRGRLMRGVRWLYRAAGDRTARQLLFPWAMDRAKARYKTAPPKRSAPLKRYRAAHDADTNAAEESNGGTRPRVEADRPGPP